MAAEVRTLVSFILRRWGSQDEALTTAEVERLRCDVPDLELEWAGSPDSVLDKAAIERLVTRLVVPASPKSSTLTLNRSKAKTRPAKVLYKCAARTIRP
jgi:hypothetical protein